MLHIYVYLDNGETYLLGSNLRLYKNNFEFCQYDDYEDAHNVELLFNQENPQLNYRLEII